MRHMHMARWALAAIAWVSMFGAARGQLPQQIVSQYRPAVERLRQAYTHASFEGTSNVAYPTQEKSREQSFVMRAAGDKRRIDVTTRSQQGMGLKVGGTEMHMATPIGSLSSYMAPGSKIFDNARQTKYADTVSQIDNGCLLKYPYSLDASGTILDMLLKPGVKVTGVKTIKADGQSLVQINYEETARHAEHMGLWKSTLVLAPAEGWALRGFSRSMSEGSDQITQRAKLTYSGFENGIPLLESIESETLSGKTSTEREAIQISKIKFGDPDDYYFTSFAF